MTDINSVVLVGRLTRDLTDQEIRYTPSGTACANISIAVNRSKKQGEQWIDEVSYFDISLFGNTVTNLKQYLTKGKQVSVMGHLKQDRWEDQQGQKKSRVLIVSENIQLLGGTQNGNAQGGQPVQQPTQQYQQQGYQNQQNSFAPQPQQAQGFPEDIPF